MAGADNSRHLAQAAADRHQTTLTRAQDAIDQLDRSGQPITFCAVAKTAGVSRAWLYRQPDVRALITRLRSTQPRSATIAPAAQRATDESLRQRLEATRAEITRLRTENAVLRDQLARSLGEQRTRT